MKINLFYLLVIFIILNIRAYLVMRNDKKIAIYNGKNKGGTKRRTSEKSLFITALCYGFIGVGIGMFFPLRHKNNKLSFQIAIPLITVVMSVLTFFILNYCDTYYDAGILFNLW